MLQDHCRWADLLFLQASRVRLAGNTIAWHSSCAKLLPSNQQINLPPVSRALTDLACPLESMKLVAAGSSVCIFLPSNRKYSVSLWQRTVWIFYGNLQNFSRLTPSTASWRAAWAYDESINIGIVFSTVFTFLEFHCRNIMFIYRIFTLLLASLLVGICAGFENPIRASDGSDPFMVYHEGYYYLTSEFNYWIWIL